MKPVESGLGIRLLGTKLAATPASAAGRGWGDPGQGPSNYFSGILRHESMAQQVVRAGIRVIWRDNQSSWQRVEASLVRIPARRSAKKAFLPGTLMADWITELIAEHGYLALFMLMFLENVFPPIPSELIMPFAGYAAARGDINPIGAVIAGSAGSLLGALAWYVVGYGLGTERFKGIVKRHGRWLTLSEADIDRAQRWFDRYGGVAVCIGRLIPAVRSVISVPAGIAQMELRRFLMWSSVGTVAWTSLLTGLGYVLGKRFTEVDAWLQPISLAIVALAVAGYLYRLYRGREQTS